MKIAVQTLASGLFGVAFFVVLLFWPAGTLNYWQAWVFIAVFIVATLVPRTRRWSRRASTASSGIRCTSARSS